MTTEALYSVTGKISGTLVTVRGDTAVDLANNLTAFVAEASTHVAGFIEFCEGASTTRAASLAAQTPQAPPAAQRVTAPTHAQAVGYVQQQMGGQVINEQAAPPQQFPNAGSDPTGPHGVQHCEHTQAPMVWKTGNRKRDGAAYEGYFCAANAQKCSRHYKCPA